MEYNEQLLTKYYRAKIAAKIRKERAIFKAGFTSKSTPSGFGKLNQCDYILFKTYTHYEGVVTDYYELKNIIETSVPNCSIYYGPLKVSFSVATVEGTECGCTECCGGCCETLPYVTVYQNYLEFDKLKNIKGAISSRLSWFLRDAKWKLEKQPTGKDAQRYVKIMRKLIDK